MERSVPELRTTAEPGQAEGATLLLSRAPRLGSRPLAGALVVLVAMILVMLLHRAVAPPGAGPLAFVAGSVEWQSAALAPEEAPPAPELAPIPAQPPVGPAPPPDAIIAPAARPDFIPSPAPAESPPSNPAPRASGEAENGRVDAPDPSHANARPSERAAKPQQPPVPAAKPAKRTASGVAANAPEAKKGAKPAAGTGRGEKEASGEGACRPYVSEQTMMGGEAAVVGTVCRGADGHWRLVSQYYNGG